jgi:Fe2+ or Zn2+ uptake regulation protein
MRESDRQHDLVELLRARGQRVTSQRLVILRELRRRARHASAEEVHRAVRHSLPGTSVPTVYATLELLVELGLARKIDAGLGVSLYDARMEPHQHTVCRRCGGVEDVDIDLDPNLLMRGSASAGFHPDGVELLILGRCNRCVEAAEGASDNRRSSG